MDVIEELIATGMAKSSDFGISHVEVFNKLLAELEDDSSEISRKFVAAQRRQNMVWSEMSGQVLGAERINREYSIGLEFSHYA